MGTLLGPVFTACDDSQDERILALQREVDQAQCVNWRRGALAPSPFLTLRLKYLDVNNTTLTLSGLPFVIAGYYANALFQHSSGASGPEAIPPLLEVAGLYNRALVLSAKYKVGPYSEGTTFPYSLMIGHLH